MMSALSGPDQRCPISIPERGEKFLKPLECNLKGVRIAWTSDLGGLPVDSRITETIEAQRDVFKDLGCIIEDKSPDFSDADEIFKTFRAWYYELNLGSLLSKHRDKIKNTVVWNIEAGLKLSGKNLGQAEKKRTKLLYKFQEFMQNYDFLALPVSQVPPFPVEQEFVSDLHKKYLNRLSDFLFNLSRIVVLNQGVSEISWDYNK